MLGWDQPDIILVTGDAYIDSPHVGVAVIGKYLLHHGFRTAIIAQPSTAVGQDITRLGEPKLFWGVTGGCVDSMVANYTSSKKRRRQDDYTPGGLNIRPDRATIAYTNLIRHHGSGKKPVVLGGIEASLRRIAHYDYWDDALRRSILFDAKADILVYGMAEKTVVELADALRRAPIGERSKASAIFQPRRYLITSYYLHSRRLRKTSTTSFACSTSSPETWTTLPPDLSSSMGIAS